MSIVNVVLDKSRAMVAVDTAALSGDVIQTAQKLLPLPAARSIVTGRGSVAFLVRMYSGIFVGAEDFDSLVGHVIEGRNILAGPMSAHLARELGAGLAREVDKNSITIVGWSRAVERMMGWCCWQEESGGAYQDRQILHAMCGPRGDDTWGGSLRVDNEGRMIEVARLQVEDMRSRGIPGHGGELIIAHIDRDSIRTRVAATL